jgi:hypothetical protein
LVVFTFLYHSDVLARALEACDTALCSAAKTHKKTSGYIDHEIENAIKKLNVYERDFYDR